VAVVSAPGRGAPAARADLKVVLETACWGLQRCRAQALDCDGQTAKRALGAKHGQGLEERR
jgi:hypothetical protein